MTNCRFVKKNSGAGGWGSNLKEAGILVGNLNYTPEAWLKPFLTLKGYERAIETLAKLMVVKTFFRRDFIPNRSRSSTLTTKRRFFYFFSCNPERYLDG